MVLFVNKSDESQSDCKELQWFQDGCNKKDTLAILSKQGCIQQTHWAVDKYGWRQTKLKHSHSYYYSV